MVLNALYDEGVDSVSVAHPSDEIGELVRIKLEADGQATVRSIQGALTYQKNCEAIPVKHGEATYDDLPDASTYTRAFVASGLVGAENAGEIRFSTDTGMQT